MGRGGRGGGGRSGGGRSGGSFGGGGRSSSSFGGSGRSGSSSGRGGRSGGSFGSGGRSGGSFGSGGRSGGSFGSGRYTGGSFGRGGFGTGLGMGTLFGMGMGRRRGFGRGRSSCGCFTFILVIIAIFIIMGVINSLNSIGSLGSIGGFTTLRNYHSIANSTVEREALPRDAADSSAPLLVDNLSWIGSEARLNRGLNDFHARTGVRPLLYITGEINGNTRLPTDSEMRDYAEKRYVELVGENPAHLLLLFFENERHEYSMWVTVGNRALTVMDDEAQGILMDFVQMLYYSDLDEDEMFSRAFSEAAERIMNVTTSPWIPVFTVFGIVLVLFICFFWWMKREEQKKREAAEMEQILNQPLHSFGDYNDDAGKIAEIYNNVNKEGED